MQILKVTLEFGKLSNFTKRFSKELKSTINGKRFRKYDKGSPERTTSERSFHIQSEAFYRELEISIKIKESLIVELLSTGDSGIGDSRVAIY